MKQQGSRAPLPDFVAKLSRLLFFVFGFSKFRIPVHADRLDGAPFIYALFVTFSCPDRHGSRIDSPRALSPWHYQGYSEYDRMLADLRRSLRERRLFSLADPRRRNLCSRLRCSQLQKKPGKRSIHLRSQLCCHLRAAEGSSSLRVLNSNCFLPF